MSEQGPEGNPGAGPGGGTGSDTGTGADRAAGPRVVVVMGVSGCGKSTVAKRLAELLGGSFKDGDELHPRENIEKMGRGEPLDDADRMPWLAAVRDHSRAEAAVSGLHVVACSALARRYREVLDGAGDVTYVFLEGSFELIASRMHERRGHFMPESLLQSQFDALESPKGGPDTVTVDVSPPPEEVALAAARALRERFGLPTGAPPGTAAGTGGAAP